MVPPSDSIARPPVRIAVAAAVGVAVGGAVYLYAVRGPALLMDLASGVSGLFCF